MAIKSSKLNQYLSIYLVRKARLLESSETTKKLLESVKEKEKLSILIAAIQSVAPLESKELFLALLYQELKVPRAEAMNLFDTAEVLSETMVPETLKEELKLIFKVAKAEERGFFYNEKSKRFSFNSNAFAKHLTVRCDIRSTFDGRLYIYNKRGFYDELPEVEMGKIIREVMHEGRLNSWTSMHEKESVKALQREAISVAEMNTNKSIINLQNGVLSLNEFELLPHNPVYLSSIQLPIIFDPNAIAPRFIRFIEEITKGDKGLICVHQEILGYLLSSEIKAEKAFFYYGNGANGKSVLASIITKLVGTDNVSSIPLAEFNQQFGLEGIINKNVNIAAENELGCKALRTENFKAIVSGDILTINIKYRPAISYKPHCKLVFLVNNLPDSTDVTNGFFRKIMIVPFPRTFSQEERDVTLIDELSMELPGILNWAIEGLKRLRSNNYKFSDCTIIEECLKNYYLEQNPVKQFFDEHIQIQSVQRTKKSEFYQKYHRWLNLQGIAEKGTKSNQIFWRYFKAILENEQIPIVTKRVNGNDYIEGIGITGLEEDTTLFLEGNTIQF